jgi:hypothetical protein
MTHGRSEAESGERVEEVRDVMSEYWDVDDDDWDTLFSTRILKKTGIRLDERADANTDVDAAARAGVDAGAADAPDDDGTLSTDAPR